jgi:hypothetical protein
MTARALAAGAAFLILTLWLPAVGRTQSLTSVTSDRCDCRTLSGQPFAGGNRSCAIAALSIPVSVAEGVTQIERVCYGIYGNGLANPHDGVEAWVATPAGPVADYALPPQSVGTYPGSTTVSACQDFSVAGPVAWNAQVWVAYNPAAQPEQWGCASPKNKTPSWLSVEVLP